MEILPASRDELSLLLKRYADTRFLRCGESSSCSSDNALWWKKSVLLHRPKPRSSSPKTDTPESLRHSSKVEKHKQIADESRSVLNHQESLASDCHKVYRPQSGKSNAGCFAPAESAS